MCLEENMKTDDFNYDLPEELIAQVRLKNREESKLLILYRDINKNYYFPKNNIITVISSIAILFLTSHTFLASLTILLAPPFASFA